LTPWLEAESWVMDPDWDLRMELSNERNFWAICCSLPFIV